MQRMAHEWDSYFHNLQPVSSDSSTLTRTTESQHFDNYIEQNDFTEMVAPQEAPATNFNTNSSYFANPSIGNSSSDCVYQKYYSETPWQPDGQHMVKDCLPSCGNGDISDFGSDGLSASASFPSSFATDLQELRQDCEMLATSFLQDYSDVSSCSNADGSSTRPSCNFMASYSVPKSKLGIGAKQHSKEWLFSHTGEICPTESLCPKMSVNNANLPLTPNVNENKMQCSQEKVDNLPNNGGADTDDRSFTFSNKVTSAGSETVEDGNDSHESQDQRQKEDVERDLSQRKHSDILRSGNEDITGDRLEECPQGNEEEQGTATFPNIMTATKPESIDGLNTPKFHSTDGQDDNIRTGPKAQEMKSHTSQTSHASGIKVSDSKDGTSELSKRTSTLKSSSQNVESCLRSTVHQSIGENKTLAVFRSPVVMSDDGLSIVSQKKDQYFAEPCLDIHTSSTDNNICVEKDCTAELSVSPSLECCLYTNKERTSTAENTNAPSSQSLDKSPVAPEPQSLDENTRESFNKLDTCTEQQSVLGLLYGEPLSEEDSDADESKLGSSGSEEMSLVRPDRNSIEHLEGESSQPTPLRHLRKLQPVVVVKHLKSVNGLRDLYHCGNCQHTTPNVDNLIGHQHSCHLVHSFEFCESCNLYSVRNGQAEKHLCVFTKESTLPSSGSYRRKRRHYEKRCIRCNLSFSKVVQYISHMRTHSGKTPHQCLKCGLYFAQASTLTRHTRFPGRCKRAKHRVKINDAGINKMSTSPQEKLAECAAKLNLRRCYVKLVDISKTHLCNICGKSFLTAVKAKKHYYNLHHGKSLNREYATNGKYKCPLCPRLFKYYSNRNRHLPDCVRGSVFGGKEKVGNKYRCPLCSATFTLISNRYRHIRTTCLRECFTRLKKSRQLKETVLKKAPQTVPRHKCNFCPAVFCHASGKYRHMKKHEVYRLTGKMFKHKNSVFSNISRTATLCDTKTEENRSLGCHFCGKYFKSSQSLKKHERTHSGERPYRCLECGKGFKKLSHLMGHKIVHQKRIQCTVCKKVLPTIGELIQHRRTHLAGSRGLLQCPDCHLQFQFPVYLIRHLEVHKNRENKLFRQEEGSPSKPQQSLQCSLCKEMFDDAQVLRKHCLTHISRSSSKQCPFCGRHFACRRNLLRHMVRHTGDKPLACTNCGKQFFSDLYLKLHSEQCLPAQTVYPVTAESNTKTVRKHKCLYCPRAFSKKIRLKNHHQGHKINSLHLCSSCGQYFGYTKIKQHRNECRGPTEHTYPLNGKSSEATPQTNQSSYKKHSKATKLLQLKCPHCTQRFRYRSLLLRHLVSHTGVQPYECMHCGHRYKTMTMCTQHEAFCNGVHKDVQSNTSDAAANSGMPALRQPAQKQAESDAEFKCKFCNKTFMKSRSLRRHILTHNEVKPYRCKACDSCFSRHDHLKVHQSRCKGERKRLEVCINKISLDDVGKGWQNKYGIQPAEEQENFDCELCSRSFITLSKLSRHVTMFHVAKSFKCTRCGSSFAHESSLKKHHKMKKCQKVFMDPKTPLSLGTDPSSEKVMEPLPVMENSIQQRIKPRYQNVCSYCHRAFRKQRDLAVHIRLHTGEKPYACEYCGERFIRNDYLQRHFEKCTEKDQQVKLLCDGCGELFSKAELEHHKSDCPVKTSVSKATQLTSQSLPSGFSCAYCSSRFLLFSQLQEHFLNAHKLETMVPPLATVSLQHHLLNIPHIKEEPLDEISDNRLNDSANLTCELDTALDQEFVCKECNMCFANKAGLKGHLRVHSAEKPFSCKTCKRSFWNKNFLTKHNRKCRLELASERNRTKPLEAPLKAQIDFALEESVLLFGENSSATGSGVLLTNFSCKDEPSTYNSDGNQVKSTSVKEEKAVQYQCSECDKSFTDGLLLISHLEDHGREEQDKRRNTCSKCGQVCNSLLSLEKHMKMHGIKQRHACPDCPKVFSLLSDLEIHRTSHDPNRPFACKLCNQRFWTRPSLNKHYSKDHQVDRFDCDFCDKTYSAEISLERHYNQCHEKEQKDLLSTERGDSEQPSDEDEKDSTDNSDSDSAPYFPCLVCSKTFSTSESLEEHQPCQLTEKPHECEECGKRFFQASQLQRHQRMHKSKFQCQACGMGFVSLLTLRKHKHIHGNSSRYCCSKCYFSFTGPSQLAEHLATHHLENFPSNKSVTDDLLLISHLEDQGIEAQDIGPNTCSKCGQVCNGQINLEKHMRMHGINPKHACPDCPKVFSLLSDLEIHRTSHDPNRPFACKLCNQRFWTRPSLNKHNGEDHPVDAFACRFCNKTYSAKASLARHYNQWHQKEQKDLVSTEQGEGGTGPPSSSQVNPADESDGDEKDSTEDTDSDSAPYFPCHVCGKTFPTSESLEDHQRCHLGEKPHECEECGKCFFQASQLQQHQRMHKTEFQCQACGRGFVSLFALRKHKHTHGKSRRYRCSKCDFSFTGPSQLAEHMATHREENFPCDICNRMFHSKSSRAEHRKSHTKSGKHPPPSVSRAEHKESSPPTVNEEELKYCCGVCDKRFKDPENFSEHGCMAAKERPYPCSVCNIYFLQESHLEKHRNTYELSCSSSEYPCNRCGSSFSSPQHFLAHLKTHVDSSAVSKEGTEGQDIDPLHGFVCPVCPQSFAIADDLIGHFPKHLDGVFECKLCTMKFPSLSELEEHEHGHLTSAAEYECTECGKSFLGSDTFRHHHCSLQHRAKGDSKSANPSAEESTYEATGEEEEIDVTGEDLYNCPHCLMQFSSKSCLLEHQNKRHLQNKPFKCEFCGKMFKLRLYLKEHERRHRLKSAENQFQCNQCKSAFNTAEDLSLHMRVHAEKEVGEYRCDMCYKSFGKMSLLNKHQESHVGEVVYECTECDKAFAFPHLLEEHQQTHAAHQ